MHKAQHLRAPREVPWFWKADTKWQPKQTSLFCFPNFQTELSPKNKSGYKAIQIEGFAPDPPLAPTCSGRFLMPKPNVEVYQISHYQSGPVSHHEHRQDAKLPDTFLEHHSSHLSTLITSPVNWTCYKAFWGYALFCVSHFVAAAVILTFHHQDAWRRGFGLQNRAWYKTFSLVNYK